MTEIQNMARICCRGVVNWNLVPGTKDKEMQPITDMGYPLYPPSLYRACSYAAGLGVPVYIMVLDYYLVS